MSQRHDEEVKELISATRAADFVDRSSSHIKKLARERKIVAKKISGVWMVDIDSLKLHTLEADATLRKASQALRFKRREGKLVFAARRVVTQPAIKAVDPSTLRTALLKSTAVTVCLLVFVGLGYVGISDTIRLTKLQVDVNAFELDSQQASIINTVVQSVESEYVQPGDQSLSVLLQQENEKEEEFTNEVSDAALFSDSIIIDLETHYQNSIEQQPDMESTEYDYFVQQN